MFSNDDFFKATITFFVSIILFISVLFFGAIVLSIFHENSLLTEFFTLFLYLTMSSIILFPVHFIIHPFYDHYFVDLDVYESHYLLGRSFGILSIIIDGLIGLWVLLMIIILLYYPIYKNILGIF